MQREEPYPVQFTVEYPDRSLDRLTTGLRIFAAVPILIVLGAVSGETWQWSTDGNTQTATAAAGGVLFFWPLLMILFRQKYEARLEAWLKEIKQRAIIEVRM